MGEFTETKLDHKFFARGEEVSVINEISIGIAQAEDDGSHALALQMCDHNFLFPLNEGGKELLKRMADVIYEILPAEPEDVK